MIRTLSVIARRPAGPTRQSMALINGVWCYGLLRCARNDGGKVVAL